MCLWASHQVDRPQDKTGVRISSAKSAEIVRSIAINVCHGGRSKINVDNDLDRLSDIIALMGLNGLVNIEN
jgi:hypothetical protein